MWLLQSWHVTVHITVVLIFLPKFTENLKQKQWGMNFPIHFS